MGSVSQRKKTSEGENPKKVVGLQHLLDTLS